LPEVKKALAEADGAALLAEMERDGKVTLQLPPAQQHVPSGAVELGPDEVQIRLQAKAGWAAAHSPQCVVILSTELTEELLAEGRARELVRLIQDRRKELNCAYTDRIRVSIVTDSRKLKEAATVFADTIKSETLAVTLTTTALDGIEPVTLRADGEELMLFVGIV
jgi:isoleucyl-tRNA synthetase